MPDIDATDAAIVLTPADADRVLQIQDTIIAAVRSATEAHKASTARIAELEADKATLTARIAELETEKAALTARVVDPDAVRPVLADLAGAVAASQAALAPAPAPDPKPEAAALTIVMGATPTPAALAIDPGTAPQV